MRAELLHVCSWHIADIRGAATICPLSDKSGHSLGRAAGPRDRLLLVSLVPIRPRVRSNSTTDSAHHARAERWHRQIVGITTYIQNPMVIAATPTAPDGEGVHTVGAHVAEGHGQRHAATLSTSVASSPSALELFTRLDTGHIFSICSGAGFRISVPALPESHGSN